MIRTAAIALVACTLILFGCPTEETSGECAIDNGGCDYNATCAENTDFVMCTCNAGFTGDGTVCTPIGAGCAVDNGGCDPIAICTEDADFTYCECPVGYIGDGTLCTLESACATDNGGCDPNAICTEDADFTYCQCDAGFAGSGFYCEVATFPELAYGFIDDDTLDYLEAEEMPIHYGSTPPEIVGTYFLNSLMDWLYEDVAYDNYYVAFSEQNVDGAINVCNYSEDSTDSSCTVSAYISGWGDECFSVYANIAGRVDACEYDATSVYSGCVDTNGDIVDYYEAFYDRNQMGVCDGLGQIGEITIIYEDDGLAEWTPS